MTKEEFATATDGKVERRDIQVREVSNGFVLAGNRRFNDAETDTNSFGLSLEGVAADTDGVIAAITNFLKTGEF